MSKLVGQVLVTCCFVIFGFLSPQDSFAASVPKATQELLRKLNLDASVLADLDRELQVPQLWIANAKKEGKLKIIGTSGGADSMKGILGSFKERYPFIEVDFFGASRHERLVKTLAAYKAGKFLGDIVFSTASHLTEFQAVGLEDLRTLPAMQNVPSAFKDANGTWVGTDLIYWCISYNTKLVKKEELPKTWEDLLTNPKWRGGNLALGNYPNLWAANLWATKGEAWTKEFLTRLFGELKPQLRKEGVTALVQLTAAGEFYGALPTTQKTAYEVSLQGAPIGFTCPAPVPASAGDAVILKGAPNVHAARVFLNWYLSKEGQIAKYAFDYALPLHEGLRIKLLPFPDQILGKEPAYRAENFEQTIMPKLGELWNNLWLGGGRSGR